MPQRPTLYLDTSVPSALEDLRNPTRMAITQQFWAQALPDYDVYISEVVLKEVDQTPDSTRRDVILQPIKLIALLPVDARIYSLAQNFRADNLVPAKKIEDALHLALAVHHGMDFLVSWNFEHMVAVKTKQRLPVLAAQNSYFKVPLIVSPLEFIGGS